MDIKYSYTYIKLEDSVQNYLLAYWWYKIYLNVNNCYLQHL